MSHSSHRLLVHSALRCDGGHHKLKEKELNFFYFITLLYSFLIQVSSYASLATMYIPNLYHIIIRNHPSQYLSHYHFPLLFSFLIIILQLVFCQCHIVCPPSQSLLISHNSSFFYLYYFCIILSFSLPITDILAFSYFLSLLSSFCYSQNVSFHIFPLFCFRIVQLAPNEVLECLLSDLQTKLSFYTYNIIRIFLSHVTLLFLFLQSLINFYYRFRNCG